VAAATAPRHGARRTVAELLGSAADAAAAASNSTGSIIGVSGVLQLSVDDAVDQLIVLAQQLAAVRGEQVKVKAEEGAASSMPVQAAAALASERQQLERGVAALRRQLRARLSVPPGSYPASLRGCHAHRHLAREAACQSIVLLRHDHAVLPFRGLRSLAVIGPLAAVANLGDRGSSDTRPEPGVVVTPLEGLRAAAAPGAVHHVSGERLPEAVALAAACESVLLVLGLDWRLEGEHIHPGDIAPILRQIPPPHPLLRRWWPPVSRAIAAITSYGSARQGGDFAAGDRTNLELPAEQVALIEAVLAANPRTVVVLMGGGAILIEAWRRHYNTVRPHSSLGYRPPAPEAVPWPVPPSGSASLHLRPTLANEVIMH
jgi:hypothetical protein